MKFLFLILALMGSSRPRVHPIVLVPGDGGNSIEGRLNKTTTVHYICDKVSDWFTLWLNLEQLVPGVVDCWVDNMKLVYDPVTHRSSDNPGVETRIPGFGNTSTVEYLDPSQRFFSVYFANLVTQLIPQVREVIKLSFKNFIFRATTEVQIYTVRPMTSEKLRTSMKITSAG